MQNHAEEIYVSCKKKTKKTLHDITSVNAKGFILYMAYNKPCVSRYNYTQNLIIPLYAEFINLCFISTATLVPVLIYSS